MTKDVAHPVTVGSLVSDSPYWENVFVEINNLEKNLSQEIPNPSKFYLDLDKEYTPSELRDLIQHFGSYLALLTKRESIWEAQCHALKQSYDNGLAIAVALSDVKSSTAKGKEAQALANNELLIETKRMQISYESALIVVQGWRKSYEHLYALASRLITLTLGELEATRLT
jgi:hypothetical protein